MSPAEVESELHHYVGEEKESLRGRWLLNGVVSQSYFDLLEKTSPSDIVGEFKVISTPSGAAYGLILSQVRNAQHRFLIPLYAEKPREFFGHTSTEALNIFYENYALEGIGLNYECPMFKLDFSPVNGLLQSIDMERMDIFITEFPDVVERLGRPSFIPSLIRGTSVKSVDLSVLVPFQEITEVLGIYELELMEV
jgi:hypothetical protein